MFAAQTPVFKRRIIERFLVLHHWRGLAGPHEALTPRLLRNSSGYREPLCNASSLCSRSCASQIAPCKSLLEACGLPLGLYMVVLTRECRCPHVVPLGNCIPRIGCRRFCSCAQATGSTMSSVKVASPHRGREDYPLDAISGCCLSC